MCIFEGCLKVSCVYKLPCVCILPNPLKQEWLGPYVKYNLYREGAAGSGRVQKAKGRQHPDFPGGHPPEYYPSLRLLNFADQTGYGVLSLRWPSTNRGVVRSLYLPSRYMDDTYPQACEDRYRYRTRRWCEMSNKVFIYCSCVLLLLLYPTIPSLSLATFFVAPALISLSPAIFFLVYYTSLLLSSIFFLYTLCLLLVYFFSYLCDTESALFVFSTVTTCSCLLLIPY